MKYLVRCSASVYLDVEIEAEDEESARIKGGEAYDKLTEKIVFPDPLEFDSFEVWDVEEV